jgi:hypothetical protein
MGDTLRNLQSNNWMGFVMFLLVRRLCAIVLLLAAPGFAGAASAQAAPQLALTTLPDLAPGVAAFPRLAGASTAPAVAINKALAAEDALIPGNLSDCRSNLNPGDTMSWERAISVTMAGPEYLSISVSDNTDCGGPHPNSDMFALVYNLDTGKPVNWQRLMGKTVAGVGSLDTADDGTSIGVLASPVLSKLFTAAVVKDGNPDCKDVLQGQDSPLTFVIWPDAKGNGIELFAHGLPFAVAVCAGPEEIPAATLSSIGVEPDFLAALAAAHVGTAP